jgi:nucleoside-diphosphate-sugar epimerase
MENMNNKFQEEIKILVTGGVGFIRSNLIEKLLKEGYEVVCLDNFNEYKIY